MAKGSLVATGTPPLNAFSRYPAAATRTERSSNVAVPATTGLVVVPNSDPPSGGFDRLTVSVPVADVRFS